MTDANFWLFNKYHTRLNIFVLLTPENMKMQERIEATRGKPAPKGDITK